MPTSWGDLFDRAERHGVDLEAVRTAHERGGESDAVDERDGDDSAVGESDGDSDGEDERGGDEAPEGVDDG